MTVVMQKSFLACIGVLLAATAMAAPAANTSRLLDVRQNATAQHTRVVFDLAAPTSYTLFTLSDPPRVVIDLADARRSHGLPPQLAGEGLVKRIRTGVHGKDLRVVLDLNTPAKPSSFVLQPIGKHGHRLVVDLSVENASAAPQAVASESSRKADMFLVAVDAGHGGHDPGATGPGGVHEKQVTLQIARRLAKRIDAQPGMHAVLTRKSDYYLGLRQRMELARKAQADLFISIHADAWRDSDANGASVYALSLDGATSEHARYLAHRENAVDLIGGLSIKDKNKPLASFMLDLSQSACISASLDLGQRILQGLGQIGALHKSSVQQAAFVVLKSPDIPSVLVETGFITNPREERKLVSASYQNKIAKVILNGIQGYVASYRPASGAGGELAKYTVQPGDTLSVIAARFAVGTTRLALLNNLSNRAVIHVGQRLVIPEQATRVASSSP